MRQPWESVEVSDKDYKFVTLIFLSENIPEGDSSCPLVCPFQVGESYEYLGKVVFCLDVSASHSQHKWGNDDPEETAKKPWTITWCWKVLNLVTAVLDSGGVKGSTTDVGTLLEVFWNQGSEPSLVKSLGGASKSW